MVLSVVEAFCHALSSDAVVRTLLMGDSAQVRLPVWLSTHTLLL
jgi:hypothetical protein